MSPPSPSSARKPVPPQRPTTPTKAPHRLRFPSAHCFVARRHPDLQHQQPAGEDPARQHDHARQPQDPEDPTLLDIDSRATTNSRKHEPENVPHGPNYRRTCTLYLEPPPP